MINVCGMINQLSEIPDCHGSGIWEGHSRCLQRMDGTLQNILPVLLCDVKIICGLTDRNLIFPHMALHLQLCLRNVCHAYISNSAFSFLCAIQCCKTLLPFIRVRLISVSIIRCIINTITWALWCHRVWRALLFFSGLFFFPGPRAFRS